MPAPPIEPWLRVALIARPHGIRGEVVADVLTDFPERLAPGTSLHLREPGAAAPSRTATVERSRPHEGRILLKIAACDSRNDAEALRGCELLVPWSERVPLDEDSIYLAHLVGAEFIDRVCAQTIGEIIGVDRESSSLELLVIQRPSGAELLVPFVKAFEPAWNQDARTLTMTLPEGLLTLEDEGSGTAQ